MQFYIISVVGVNIYFMNANSKEPEPVNEPELEPLEIYFSGAEAAWGEKSGTNGLKESMI